MSRRIEIELTSVRGDGSWTWRAAGAREPRGTVDPKILPDGAKVGEVLRVEAEFYVDGIEITSVVPTKDDRREPERLELLGRPRDEPLVTSTVTPRGRDDRRDDRRGGRGRERDSGRERDGGREPDSRPRPEGGDRKPGERRRREGEERRPRDEHRERPRRGRPAPPPMPAVERPKAKRLRAGRVHRKAFLESLPEEQRPVAEQLFSGGLPAVRQAIAKQNEELAAQGKGPIADAGLLGLAEKLWPRARAADWRDRAEAALADVDELDLRDLRAVVSHADGAARDEQSRAIAGQLREALTVRVDKEHAAWLAELVATLDVGRVVRALRVSSRPPKAGAPLPPELAEAASAALTADAAPERWVAVLDALALSPVRDRVIPTSLPTELHADVRTTIARVANRIPKVAHIFEIEPDPTIPRPKPERRKPRGKAPARPPKSAPTPAPESVSPEPGPEPAAGDIDAPGESPAAPASDS